MFRRLIIEYGLKPSDSLYVGAMFNIIDTIISEDTDYDKIENVKGLMDSLSTYLYSRLIT